MPSVYDLKPRFQGLLRPVMKMLASIGLTPNGVTLIAIIGSISVGAVVSRASAFPGLFLLLPVWLFLRMALNAIDGMMARELHLATPLGAVLNELGDAISDLGLYLPLALINKQLLWPVVAFTIGAVLTEFCGVLGRALGGGRHYEGPMGKSDRAALVGTLALFAFFTSLTHRIWPWVFWAAVLLEAITCWNRTSKALADLKPGGEQDR